MRKPFDHLLQDYPTKSLIGGLFMALGLAGCAAMLPSAQSDTSSFETFDAAKLAIESLVPMQSGMKELRALGLDPKVQSNMVILTHAEIVRRFVPAAVLKVEDLDPGVLVCLQARDRCRGLEYSGGRIAKVRSGNFFSDFTNFTRKTSTSGWRFNGLILLVNDLVVYRSWGGEPVVNEVEVRSNPLGPLQDIGPTVISQPVTR